MPQDFRPDFDFFASTLPFLLLYRRVSDRLRQVAVGYNDPGASRWMESLIQGFEREYHVWGTSPALRKYLEMAEQKAKGSPLLRLLAHAYLHISYDLPRVLAESLPPSGLSEGWARELYERLLPEFQAVWSQAVTDPAITGPFYSRGIRLLVQRDYLDASIYYILALRYQAWSNSLRMQPGQAEILLDLVEYYLENVPDTKNPVRWVARLQPPILREPYDFGERTFPTLREGTEKPGLTGKNPPERPASL